MSSRLLSVDCDHVVVLPPLLLRSLPLYVLPSSIRVVANTVGEAGYIPYWFPLRRSKVSNSRRHATLLSLAVLLTSDQSQFEAASNRHLPDLLATLFLPRPRPSDTLERRTWRSCTSSRLRLGGVRAPDVHFLARCGRLQNGYQALGLDVGCIVGRVRGTGCLVVLWGSPKRWANWRVGWRLAAMSKLTGDCSDQGEDLKVRRRVLHTSCAGLAHGIRREAFRDIHILDVA